MLNFEAAKTWHTGVPDSHLDNIMFQARESVESHMQKHPQIENYAKKQNQVWVAPWMLSPYPEIGDANFRCAFWIFKWQLTLKVWARCGISIVLRTSLYCGFQDTLPWPNMVSKWTHSNLSHVSTTFFILAPLFTKCSCAILICRTMYGAFARFGYDKRLTEIIWNCVNCLIGDVIKWLATPWH